MPDSIASPALPGLIAAFQFADGMMRPLDPTAASEALAQSAAPLWLHFDLIDVRTQVFLRQFDRLSDAARATLLEPDATIHLDPTETGLAGTLPDFHHDDTQPQVGLLHFVLLPDLLVTARRHPLQAAQRVARETLASCPITALAAILRCTAEELARAQLALGVQLNHFEDALLRDIGDIDRMELGRIRRTALRLARQFGPAARLLEELHDDSPAWLVPLAAPLLRESRRLTAALRGLEGVQERSRIAQDTLLSLTAEQTNRRLFVLSVLSAAILPATLISGIFGMNVGGLPGVEQPWGFGLAMALIAGSIVSILGALRLFRLL